MSLVPLGVVGLGVLSAFPNFASVRHELLALVFHNFVPSIGEQAAYWFQTFAASAAQTTAIGIIGIAGTGILLLVTVEDQLNALWRVTTPRPWSQRVLVYWTMVTLGPLLVGASLTLSTYLDTAARHAGLSPEALAHYAAGWPHYFARAVPFVLELIACTLLYCLIPNCSVRWRDGVVGAAVAALAVEILKIGFAIYIGTVASYQTVYGALAGIPIFLLWMYVSWNAVLLGAVVAANLPTWRVDERLAHIGSGGVRLGFGLALIAALARAQRRGAACRIALLAAELGVPTSVVDEHLQTLARAGFAAPTQDGGWVLAWSLDERDIARSLRRARPAARRHLAGAAAGAVAAAGGAGDGADRPGRGGGDAADPGDAAGRDPPPGSARGHDAGRGSCRARRVGVGEAVRACADATEAFEE